MGAKIFRLSCSHEGQISITLNILFNTPLDKPEGGPKVEEISNDISTLPAEQLPSESQQENTTAITKKRGRPPGAKNKDTLFKELMAGKFHEIARHNIEKTFQVLFEEAHDGNMQAIKMIMDRVVPATKAVDMDTLEKKGLTISISVGNLEDSVPKAEVIEDVEYEEVVKEPQGGADASP